MKLSILIITALLLSSCSATNLIGKIPNAQFDRFEYHRGGNVTSADVQATNAVITDGELKIQELRIKADYGPMVNFNIYIEGYRRVIEEE